jgi:hypothetical protein
MMEVLILVLVIIGALFVMASGMWVAMTLAKVVSAKQSPSTVKRSLEEKQKSDL